MSSEYGKTETISQEGLKQALSGKKETWLILYRNPRRTDIKNIEHVHKEIITTSYELDSINEFYGIKLYHYVLYEQST